jgi:hypothetical protein
MENSNADDYEPVEKSAERKRQREKQRRIDLAEAFDELGAMVSRLRDKDESGERLEVSGLSRFELIGETIETVRRLEQEMVSLKQQLNKKTPKGDTEDNVSLPSKSPWANSDTVIPCMLKSTAVAPASHPESVASHQATQREREGQPTPYAYGYQSAYYYDYRGAAQAPPGGNYPQQYPEQQQHYRYPPAPPPSQQQYPWGYPPAAPGDHARPPYG